MKNITSVFKLPLLINILTLIVFFFASLESFFYLGFIHKHLYFSFHFFLVFYLFISYLLLHFKKISLSSNLIKLNQYLFLPSLIVYLLLIYLEEINYPNFIYGHIHINPANFIYLPLVSLIIIFIYQNKKFQKLFYFVLPLLAVYLSQIISFGNNFDFQKFSTPRSILINYFLWLGFLLISLFPFKKRKHSFFLFSFFFVLFSLINHYKIKYLNVFFSLSDLKLANNAPDFIFPFIKKNIISFPFILLTFLFSLILFLINKFYKQNNPVFKFRLLLFIIALLFIIYPIYYPDNYKNKIIRLNIDLDFSNPINNCKNNGILFCFIDDFKNFRFPVPKSYSQYTINQIYLNLKSIELTSEKLKSDKLDIKPNIIIILSEALWDIIKLPQTKFSQDPIKNIRSDIKSTLISPVYGGSTANVEFEILTGLSNFFLKDRYPYNELINQNMPSLFSLFKDEGYLNTAIHPFKKSMYRRPMVYQYFGLDKFIAMEDMLDYKFDGSYISDKSFTQEIINQFESTNQPQFIFTLSMQNHMPYEGNSFSNQNINFESPLEQKNQSIVKTYVNGINLSDQSYQFLKDYLKKSKKPTLLIFYGDHLPFLGNDFGIYKELKFIPQNQFEWSFEDYKNMYSTPIAIWSNYSTDINIKPFLSPNFLSLEILKFAKIKPKYQFAFLQSISNYDSILTKQLPNKFTPQQLNDYELIQYDVMIGKQYSLK